MTDLLLPPPVPPPANPSLGKHVTPVPGEHPGTSASLQLLQAWVGTGGAKERLEPLQTPRGGGC